MLGEVSEYGIELLAISPDTLAEARRMKRSTGLSMPLLSDEHLEVIDLYGLRHPKGLAAPRDGKIARPLAIPTTVLIDAQQIVRWIDQTGDYRLRSNPDRVIEALREHLDRAPVVP